MDRAQPDINLVRKRELDLKRKIHKENLRNIRPGIDNRPPDSTQFPKNKANTLQKEKERNNEIIRVNNLLLKRMEGILMQNSYRQSNSRFRKKSQETFNNSGNKRETPLPLGDVGVVTAADLGIETNPGRFKRWASHTRNDYGLVKQITIDSPTLKATLNQNNQLVNPVPSPLSLK